MIIVLTFFCGMLAGCRTEVTSLSPEMDLQIREDYIDFYFYIEGDDRFSVDDLWIDFVGEYHGAYAIYMNGPFAYTDTPTLEQIEDLIFHYGSSYQMEIYQDGKFYGLEEAYEAEVMTYKDFQKLHEIHVSERPYFYE